MGVKWTLIITTQRKQCVEAIPGMLGDNRTETASYREQITKTGTATPENIIHRYQKSS